jgi:hypothetical protein
MDHTIAVTVERRKDARIELRLPILLFGAECENLVRSETVNVSKNGFYCATKEPFAPGDRLRCLLSISAPSELEDSELYLDAEIEVMRVLVDSSGFGLGCRISHYHIINQKAVVSPIRERMRG